MPEPSGINLQPYHDAGAELRNAGIEVREQWHKGERAIYIADSGGVMRQTNILAVIQRWRDVQR